MRRIRPSDVCRSQLEDEPERRCPDCSCWLCLCELEAEEPEPDERKKKNLT